MAVPGGPFAASPGPGGGHFLGVGMDYTVVGMGGYSGLGEAAYHHHATANASVNDGDGGGGDGRGENDTNDNNHQNSSNGNDNGRHTAMLEQERRQSGGYRDARHENVITQQQQSQNQNQNPHQYQLPPSSANHHSYYHNSQQQRQVPSGQFGILKPGPNSASIASISEGCPSGLQRPGQFGRYQNAPPTAAATAAPYRLGQAKLVVDPPDLQAWREKLFHVDDIIILTHEQFETYFPHIDNVYSHRSTQRYKRKPFISHYWDCRMKGRPPGTPKSDDPAKKKRKRSARERDLCDVKIKITEYFPDAGAEAALDRDVAAAIAAGTAANAVVSTGQRFWTIQRVNGNGGNGKGDGVAGPHRHTLERSDEIKKSSVQRFVALRDKEAKKPHKTPPQKKSAGAAQATVRMHNKEADLKLYAASFCPFSHRVWIALEAKGQPYQYIETDPFKRPAPTPLLEANPRGRVPAIRQGDWACSESAVILEYINTLLIPTFFSLLESSSSSFSSSPQTVINSSSPPSASPPTSPLTLLQSHLTALILAADEQGPYFLGPSLSLVDVHFAPFALRLGRILRHRHPNAVLADPAPDMRWRRWLEALERNPHVQATMYMDDFYLDTADLLIQMSSEGD
ncbi:glutathione S-transferase U2 [Trichoderma asperellum]|uniref:Glutathione S-transferase U2 n=1 Tax=Trichoderma asperellum TaxID=101201 RepID=A0A6V8QJU4_TRIAP|nr:glutathione S-transferase U2 [Trichoderma asperellum]